MKNPWQLYQSIEGWQGASSRLDEEFAITVALLDDNVAKGMALREAVQLAWCRMELIMDGLRDYGADDSEGREELAHRLGRHLRECRGLASARLDRWGGIVRLD